MKKPKLFIVALILNSTFLILNSPLANAQYTKLLDFTGAANGRNPQFDQNLIYDGTFLYGMTILGGAHDSGTVFKIKPDGSGYADLFDFNGTNGYYPYGSLVSDGTFLYGMTSVGGPYGNGVLFKIEPDGSGYVGFLDCVGSVGSNPKGSLIYDGLFLYGMITNGGANGMGTIFKIETDGSLYTHLLDFAGAANGRNPVGSLISDGIALYGMTYAGGTNDQGVVFKINFDGSGNTDLLNFNNTNGNQPAGSFIYDG